LENLARVRDIVGVDRSSYSAHDAHGFAVRREQELDLATTKSVLSGAGAIERECAMDFLQSMQTKPFTSNTFQAELAHRLKNSP
jgi:hypothetical protein